jgi:hypothetical protein
VGQEKTLPSLPFLFAQSSAGIDEHLINHQFFWIDVPIQHCAATTSRYAFGRKYATQPQLRVLNTVNTKPNYPTSYY